MPLNPPSAIDRRGLTPLASYDGSRASAWPQGDKPAGAVPENINDLMVSSGPGQATLSWTPNGAMVKLYRRDVTASGSFQLVTDQISGSANVYADQGLVGGNDYEYRIRPYNQFGDSQSFSNTVSVTVGVPVGGNFQLQAGQYSPSRMAFQWVNPNGSETSRSAYNWSHSQFDYVRPFTVLGGSPPYHFELASAVPGVSVTKRAPAWNPYFYLWCDVVIDHTIVNSGSVTFTVDGYDQNGTKISVTKTVQVNDSKFVVMQDGASAGGTGTLASPYEDLIDIYTTDDADATHQDKIIVGRQGTYLIDNFDPSNSSLVMNLNKPCGWIPYPGETMNFTNQANILIGVAGTSSAPDYFFGKANYNGGDGTVPDTKVFSMQGRNHNRIVFDRPGFYSPPYGTVADDNASCIYSSADTGDADHLNISVVDGYWEGLPGGTQPDGTGAVNGMSAIDLYATKNVAIVGGTMRNCNPNYGVWIKSRNHLVMVAGFDAYDPDGQDPKNVFHFQQGSAGGLTEPGVVQAIGCKGYKTDGLFVDKCLTHGDSNSPWGTGYSDRMTIVGSAGYDGGASAANGTAYLSDSLVFNDDTNKIPPEFVTSNVTTGARSQISNYLDGNGDVQTGLAGHGTIGANFVAPEAS